MTAKGKTKRGKWVYGYYVQVHLCEPDGRVTVSHEIYNDSLDNVWTTIRKSTLCFSTEQEDINGKMIYEGDCVKMMNKRYERVIIGHVYYDSEKAQFMCFVSEDTFKSDYPVAEMPLNSELWKIEVTGNIYD